jgi:26S proteasome regulatory subunit (ATPase 3-interacting protein)
MPYFYYFAELAQIKSTPTDSELAVQIDEIESKVRRVTHFVLRNHAHVFSRQVAKLREHLEPLRAGTPLVSTAELNALDAEWTKWRSEWVKRRKVFYKCALAFVSLSPLASPTGTSTYAD